MYKYKRVHVPSGESKEETLEIHRMTMPGKSLLFPINKVEFLELVNNWNRLSLLQSNVTGKITWMYIAL